MTEKPYKQQITPTDPRLRAGVEAERQMAHYLHRRFHDDPETHVLHGLRLEDREQPEQSGSPGVCQIDHLVVHRWGMFIIESKSVSEEVRVRPDDTGGDEWSRVYQGREVGMSSPIQQARRQSEFLRTFLERHREELFGRQSFGLRAIARLLTGKDHGGFLDAPIQLMIAISDRGRISRLGGWKEPQEPFPVFVTKADLVPDKIAQELEQPSQGRDVVGQVAGRVRPVGHRGTCSEGSGRVSCRSPCGTFRRRAAADEPGRPEPEPSAIASNAHSPGEHDGSVLQGLPRKGSDRDVGQVRILLAVRLVRQDDFDAPGVFAMRRRRTAGQRGTGS